MSLPTIVVAVTTMDSDAPPRPSERESSLYRDLQAIDDALSDAQQRAHGSNGAVVVPHSTLEVMRRLLARCMEQEAARSRLRSTVASSYRVPPKQLVRRLTTVGTTALERAVVEAASMRIPEVTSVLMLAKLLDDDASAASALLASIDVDRAAAVEQAMAAVARMPSDHEGRPVFATGLFKWFEETWLSCSLEWGARSMNSAHLLVQWVRHGARYDATTLSGLDGLDVEQLEARLPSVSES